MATEKIKINFSDPALFGNDAAEDEEEDVFQAFALLRDEVNKFSDPTFRICIARAYKGEGKSALLRLSRARLSQQEHPPLVVSSPATSLVPQLDTSNFAQWVKGWKREILARLANEIGAHIGFAWTDDQMGLVEEAEKQGFKERSIIWAILRRIVPKVEAGNGKAKVSATLEQPGLPPAEGTVKRWAQGRTPIWLFLDDVDQNFQNTPEQKAKVASFFVACRELTNVIPELRIRAAVRPNVWTTVKMEFEALSHVEQYMSDLTWSEESIRSLLAKRIEGYLKRNRKWDAVDKNLSGDRRDREKQLIALVFEDPMRWGASTRPPHVLLYTLSKHRPRWLVELCKIAGAKAHASYRERISREDIVGDLGRFGGRRIEDTVAEFRSQCSEVEELIAAFRKEPEELSTDELFSIIDRKILSHSAPKIVGVIGTAAARDVAAFLFQIGFFYGRRDKPDGAYEHITYSERPSLFRARTNIDDGLKWEVHPVFRQALEMRDAEGRELGTRRR